MNQREIGQFMSVCRKEKGLTQAQLAERLGVSDKSISRWETGKTMPDLSLYELLSEILTFVGIVVTITLTQEFAVIFEQKIITAACGSFVWGFGILLSSKIRKALTELENQ